MARYENMDDLSLSNKTIRGLHIRKCADSVWMKSKERTGELILKMRC